MTLTLKRKPERTDASFRWTVPRVHIWDSGAHLSITYTALMESLLLGWWCQNLVTRNWWMWIQVERTDGCCSGRKESVIFKVGGKRDAVSWGRARLSRWERLSRWYGLLGLSLEGWEGCDVHIWLKKMVFHDKGQRWASMLACGQGWAWQQHLFLRRKDGCCALYYAHIKSPLTDL